jgi:hypothetical protein
MNPRIEFAAAKANLYCIISIRGFNTGFCSSNAVTQHGVPLVVIEDGFSMSRKGVHEAILCSPERWRGSAV